ncbi:endopeptidase La [Mangrovibacterium marinum]|uniref:Lon protease n=1 Tax=Mangrovibacterium marinum TaxID=1639118 RepID=A0A2T5C3X7_9BACT|nr:endopeptidase La [Mangrovibacterium marinum]PTN09496.1 ATP-dependent Lon protease [Mangrovibacterium marinum]
MENNTTENAGIVLVSEVYPDNIVVLPLENRPVFPGLALPLNFVNRKVVKAVLYSIEKNGGFIGVSYIKEENKADFFDSRKHRTGTLLKILKIINKTDDSIQFFAQAVTRFHYKREVTRLGIPHWQVEYEYEEKQEISNELKAYTLAIINLVKKLIQLNPMFQEQMKLALSQVGMEKPGLLMDLVASFLTADGDKLQPVLESIDLFHRSDLLLKLLKEEIELNELQQNIQKQIEEKISSQQREFFLREQLKIIKQELGLEKDDKTSETETIEKKIQKLVLSDEVAGVIQEELNKLQTLESGSAEYQVSRTYLNWLTDLPWGVFSEDNYDLAKARQILDEQHYGLNDVKQRILEFVSTIVKRRKVSGSIICLVGPPGVGKTSIGKSIADALGREFYRFSVGGMRDEAEIKGHRRTYIGAMPGKLIQSLKRTGVSNPVIMLDEIDKIGASYQGDPASALLEVLDPEQNSDFLDHYLDVRYDLSNILFVTTANQLDTIPRPLLDRMEIIKLSGYILEEKVEIAKRYLIPKQRKEHGLKASEVNITDAALVEIADSYAREAGVRDMENQIKKIMRKSTLLLTENGDTKINVSKNNLSEFLGQAVFTTEELYQKSLPGVTLGLAWTALGGATLYIEAQGVKGRGPGLKQTGQLGNVMQESSEIAYSYVQSLLENDQREFFKNHLVHLHVPAGATPKDGPSAGITMALAMYSLAINQAVRKGLAMTGELTLTGKVLPIGGVREKTIAARRVKVFELIFPAENRKDFEALPDYLKEGITPHFVNYFEEVIKIAFAKK